MRTLIRLMLLALAALPAHSAGVERLESILPGESTLMLLIDDAPAFLAAWPESPLGMTWNDPQVKRFVAPLRDRMQLDRWEELTHEKTGFRLSEILEALTGQAALVIGNIDLAAIEAGGDAIAFGAIAEAEGGKEIFKTLMGLDLQHTRDENLGQGVAWEEVEEEFRGEILHLRKRVTEDESEEAEGWAFVDDLAIVAQPKSFLQELVANVKDRNTDDSLGRSAAFARIKQRSPESDVLIYCNFEKLFPAIRQALSAQEEAAEPNALGITPSAVLDALGLENIQGAYVSTDFAKTETVIDAGLLYTGNQGIVKLLAYGPGPVELPEFLPDGLTAASVTHFSIPEAWRGLREVLAALNPAIPGLIDVYLQQFTTRAGFDLEKSLFGSLGTVVVSAQFPPEAVEPGVQPTLDQMESLIGISITDRQTLEMALEGLKTLMGPGVELFDETEYMGRTIYTSKQGLPAAPGAPAQHLSYMLTEDYFFASSGSAAPLHAVLRQHDKPGRSIWKRKEIKAALGRLPRGTSSLLYYDVSSLLGSIAKSIATVQQLTSSAEAEGDEGEEPREPFCNPAELPGQEVFDEYFGIGVAAVHKSADGLFVTVRLLRP